MKQRYAEIKEEVGAEKVVEQFKIEWEKEKSKQMKKQWKSLLGGCN